MSRTDTSWPNVARLIARGRALYGAQVCAVDGAQRLTYAALCERATRLGNALRAMGLKAGDRVALMADNSALCLEAYLGVPAAGLVLLPLNARLAAPEIRSILEDSGAAAFLVGHGHEDTASTASAGLTITLIGQTRLAARDYEQVLAGGADRLPPEGSAEEIAYLYYTSGTTGRPKGVMLSHANVMAGALSAVASLGMNSTHTWLHAGPMFHLADAFAIWGMTWLGGRHVCMRFKPDDAIRIMEDEKVTHSLLVPTALDMLSDAAARQGTRLPTLQTMLYGGAPMPPAILGRARERLSTALIATYGMTETSGLLTAADPRDLATAHDPGNVGREVPLVRLEILGDGDAPAKDGEVGEVVVTSPAVMKGYRGLPTQTAEVLAGQRLRTGDVARREPDGTITLVDRKKDMIISGGENVYSREVELVLERHPSIAEVAIVGQPDPRWGEAVCAVTRLKPGTDLSIEELRTFARASLAGYKLPRNLLVLDDLPRTASGKISKGELRQMAAQRAAAKTA